MNRERRRTPRFEGSGNPWKRLPATPDLSASEMRYFHEYAFKHPKFKERADNDILDGLTKQAALKANPCVVALECFIGLEQIIRGSGTIIESHDNDCIVLTSANLIRRPTSDEDVENVLARTLKVYMHSYDGRSSCVGEICAYDFHWNLAAIKFRTATRFEPATLAPINDSKDVSHQPFLSLTPGDHVVAIGRFFAWPFELMAAPGCYRLKRTDYECKELFTTTCVITGCGDGGPIINNRGEVIGVTYYDYNSTHCMPINIAWKWWQHYKKFGKCCRPYLGIEATNLSAAGLGLLERIIAKFPHVSKGVLMEKVISGSCADLAGICVNDIIIKCAEKTVESFLEFFEIIMDHVGDFVEIVLIRANSVTPIHVKLKVVEVGPDQINSWPNCYYM